MTSSSFATNEVIASRKENFAELARLHTKIDDISHTNFHRSHMPERGAYSVCMHRDDAETLSFTHIHVTHADAKLRYYPAAPCRATKAESSTLFIKQAMLAH